MKKSKYLILAFLTLIACNGSHHKVSEVTEDTPAAPIVNYIRSIDYTDTVALHDENIMQERMANLTKLILKSDSLSLQTGLSLFFNNIKHDEKALNSVTSLANLYLNNPASPVRDTNRYIDFLNALLSVDSIPSSVREIEEERLHIAALNRPGIIATDFNFVNRDGTHSSLHQVTGNKTLLIFFDPECSHCSDILKYIAKHPRINSAISDSTLTVLAIYAEGKKDVWENTKHAMPPAWTVGYDMSDILDNELYDLPAMPTLYLLDSDKRVILKDPDANHLVQLF
ncbi:MAG: DUF5106 domain-containing protein [Muribaculaceae bacterium]|nr:DUF5106 domain-containing protein [Muribaculaceae bacterium]